jgi:hypothetical protein
MVMMSMVVVPMMVVPMMAVTMPSAGPRRTQGSCDEQHECKTPEFYFCHEDLHSKVVINEEPSLTISTCRRYNAPLSNRLSCRYKKFTKISQYFL